MHISKRINYLYKMINATFGREVSISTSKCPRYGTRTGILIEWDNLSKKEVNERIIASLANVGFGKHNSWVNSFERKTEKGWQYVIFHHYHGNAFGIVLTESYSVKQD